MLIRCLLSLIIVSSSINLIEAQGTSTYQLLKKYPCLGVVYEDLEEELLELIDSSSAALLIYLDVDDEKFVRLDHLKAFSSSGPKIDEDKIATSLQSIFRRSAEACPVLNKNLPLVLPIAIHHPVWQKWNDGIEVDFRKTPEARSMIHQLHSSDRYQITPILYLDRNPFVLICSGGR